MLSTPRELKAAARHSLSRAYYDPKKLILIHTGVTVLLSALLLIIDYLLEQKIGNTGGLGGLGDRAILSTIRSVLQFAQFAVLPFWQIGYLYAALCLARGESAEPDSLLTGFRRYGSILRLMLLMGVILFGLIIVCSYAAGILFVMSPWGEDILDQLTPMLEDATLLEDPALLEQMVYTMMEEHLLPIVLIFCFVFLAVLIPALFLMRFAQYGILDGNTGVFSALRTSMRISLRNIPGLLKLDFSFWWFYALDLLLGGLCYADMLLAEFGIALPWNAATSYFMFNGLYLLGLLALQYAFRNRVEVAYAHAYCELTTPTE